MTKENQLVEVARSFTYKLNTGNYESRDFFCSQKAECLEKEAVKKSEELYEFCKNEVMKSVGKYLEEKQSKAIAMGTAYKKKLDKAKSDADLENNEGELQEDKEREKENKELSF